MGEGLIFTNDNCISCNKCVRVCTSPGASYVEAHDDASLVHIHPERCIACGACFALCEHEARDYRDDTQEFFSDLKKGEKISLLLAPAFKATYPEEYGQILGGLKDLGINRIISVSFGADICTWAYLNYIKENNFYGGISSPCPVAVSYIEHCLPELIPCLIPVYSPMLCAAIYCRKVLGITDRLAFISPCIGKKFETDTYMETSPVHYNLTFMKFMEHVRKHGIFGEDATDEIEYGLGSFYPSPGGLADNVRWFLGDDTLIRVVSGKTFLYRWFRRNAEDIKNHKTAFFMIDALNCQEGCLEGTANEAGRFNEDHSFSAIQKIRSDSKKDDLSSPWNQQLTIKQRFDNLNKQFCDLSLSDYLRSFTDMSALCATKTPSEAEADEIFHLMHKDTPESRQINCSACGYFNCHDMMVAIYNGFNTRSSCIHYQMDEALRLERLSMSDQLTGVMNRTGLQNVLGHQYINKTIAVIAADVNGLKEVNDTQGHEAGDHLIVTVANCLTSVFGRGHVFRTGGDEFVAIQADHTEEECVRGIERTRELMNEKAVSAAIGYTYSSAYDSNFTVLQEQADKKMYEDKELYYQRTGKKRRKK